MRIIERSTAFKRDYKRIGAGKYRAALKLELTSILERLVNDQILPSTCRDHELSGNWNGCRECHVKPDLLLIYSLPDANTIRLARLGTHSDLFR